MALHTGYAVRIYTDAMGAAVVLGGITRQSVVTGSEARSEATAGSAYARHQSIVKVAPRVTFATTDIKTALDNVGTLGLKIASATNAGVELYQVQLDTDGRPLSGSNHRKIAVRKGLLVPRRLTAEHGQDAQIELEAIAIYDGTNAPLVVTESVALPSGLDDPTRWTLGAFTFGSVALAKKSAVELDFGLTVEAMGVDGDIYETFLAITEALPRFTVRGHNVSQFASGGITITGLAGTHANSKLFLRKRTEDAASFVANGTAEHISITANGVAYFDEAFAGERNSPATTSAMIHAKHDGTNDPLVLNTATAIS